MLRLEGAEALVVRMVDWLERVKSPSSRYFRWKESSDILLTILTYFTNPNGTCRSNVEKGICSSHWGIHSPLFSDPIRGLTIVQLIRESLAITRTMDVNPPCFVALESNSR